MIFKIIHIHSDQKFVYDSKIFERNNFVNEFVIFGKESDYKGPYKESIKFFSYSKKDISKVIVLCNSADIVVMWRLDFTKCYIANRLLKRKKVIWRFFGFELYSKIPDYVFSKKTLSAKNSERINHTFIKKTKHIAGKIEQLVKYQTTLKNEFSKALQRVDYFICLSKTEYQFLRKYWLNLPSFIQYPFTLYSNGNKNYLKKTNQIIVGNNRSAFNNHLDIIDLIKNSNNKGKYSFLILFNYGPNNAYSNAVRRMAHEIKEVTVLDDFLSYDEFMNLYVNASAFVMNGHRQMAMANVLQALKNDVKVYLNEKNVILEWLREEGFFIFTIVNFVADIKTNNINLSKEEVQHNRKQIIKFIKKYNQEDFHNTLLQIITKNTN